LVGEFAESGIQGPRCPLQPSSDIGNTQKGAPGRSVATGTSSNGAVGCLGAPQSTPGNKSEQVPRAALVPLDAGLSMPGWIGLGRGLAGLESVVATI
jgi:hypothetical protein